MLKKTAYIIIAFYLLISSVGFPVIKHFCNQQGEISSVYAPGVCSFEGVHSSDYHECEMCHMEIEMVRLDINYTHDNKQNTNFSPSSVILFRFQLPLSYGYYAQEQGVAYFPKRSTRHALIQVFFC